MNSILSGKKVLSAFALALGALLLCACPRVDPMDPVGPEGPDGPEVPEKPYFNLMTSSGTSVPQDYELVYNRDAVSVAAMTVKTNVTDWSVTSSDTWCSATADENNNIILQLQEYGESREVLPPRICTVSVQAGAVFNQTIKVVQQSYVVFSFEREGQPVVLPASGATIDVPVYTNSYQWTPISPADWIKLEQQSPSILRVTTSPRPVTESSPRSALVTVHSSSDEYAKGSFEVRDEDATLSGEDYQYGEHIDWD